MRSSLYEGNKGNESLSEDVSNIEWEHNVLKKPISYEFPVSNENLSDAKEVVGRRRWLKHLSNQDERAIKMRCSEIIMRMALSQLTPQKRRQILAMEIQKKLLIPFDMSLIMTWMKTTNYGCYLQEWRL